ncbi:MAG: cation-translocating P-type ATPase [Solirubrobacterales bacterium]|nr:cation-translocating P-type ATPase [Solirubrobacterales bacterium]
MDVIQTGWGGLRDRWRQPAVRRAALTGVAAILFAVALSIGKSGNETTWSALMLAATAVAGTGIAVRALTALGYRQIGIELLVTIAVLGAIVIGEYWEAAAVTFLFTFGAMLEAMTLSRTRGALTEMLALVPDTATVIRDGQQVEVGPTEVEPGESVLVKPGGKISVDGVITDGIAAIDESGITGESMPRSVGLDDGVFAGTVLTEGTVTVRATGIGSETTLGRIVQRVEEAQEMKAPAQRMMERFASWYTPSVVVLAAAVYALGGGIEMALTLLVIACPGALVISMPVSIVAGIGRAARRGVLIKGGEHLEAAGKVDAIALDKTGTLTRGRPVLEEIAVIDPASTENDILGWAAAAEAGSEHPLGTAILTAADKRGLEVPAAPEEFEVHVGRGVEASVDGDRVMVGTLRLMDESGIEVPETAADRIERMTAIGRTAMLVARGEKVVGVLAVADEIRPDAAPAIAAMRKAGVKRIVMLTGDSERVARAVGDRVGITEVHAGLLPDQKLELIRSMQADGQVVAMVGDGVNDAPALVASDVGVAMGLGGTDVAIETADIALVSDHLPKIVEAIKLSRLTVRNLRQNVGVALATVVTLLAGVMVGEVQMAGGMFVHQISVVVVILNAMRLLRAKVTVDETNSSDETGISLKPVLQG